METYEPKKLTEAMLRFQYMPFKTYLSELKKQGVKLSAKEQMELLKLYEEYQEEINILSKEIEKKYNELNEIVFVIYGISKNDAEYIKSNVHM